MIANPLALMIHRPQGFRFRNHSDSAIRLDYRRSGLLAQEPVSDHIDSQFRLLSPSSTILTEVLGKQNRTELRIQRSMNLLHDLTHLRLRARMETQP